MVIKANVFKTFLIFSNILLLCVGLTVSILGFKMYWALSLFSLTSIPLVQNAVNAAMAAGVFISCCSFLGLFGGCNESKAFIMWHLIFLGIIVILEFSVGVTLMMIKKSVSAAVGSSDCSNVCTAAVDAAILNYALPSAGLMMSVMFVEALMIYSSIRLYFFIRDRSMVTGESRQSIVELDVHMQNVDGTQAAFVTPHATESGSHSQRNNMHHVPFHPRTNRCQSNIEERPPDYNSLYRSPPHYSSDMRYDAPGTSSSTSELPNDTDDALNPV